MSDKMKARRTNEIACRIMLALLMLAALSACLPPGDRATARYMAKPRPDTRNSARLSCFLHLKSEEGPVIRLEITGLEVLADGLWLPIADGPLEIDSREIGAGQVFLGGLSVPPGEYRRMRLTVTRGMLRQTDGEYAGVTPEPFVIDLILTSSLTLEPGDSRSLFISWDVENSLGPGDTLRPDLTLYPSQKQLNVDLVFVACPDIDTIFVVRADEGRVVDSFGIEGGPTYLDVDPDKQNLYVLASRDRTVKVVDLSSYRVVDFFPVFLNDEPSYMTVTPDGLGAFLLDERRGYLSRMDLSNGRSIARVLINQRPSYVLFMEDQNLLAVSQSLSQRVLLLDPLSLSEAGSFPSGSSPEGLFISDNRLYVAESRDNSISVVNLSGSGSRDRIAVGFGPRRLMGIEDRIYVSNYEGGSLSVLVPGQLGVIQEIYGLGRPLEMAVDKFYRRLYVADEKASALAVIDINSNLLLGYIALGAQPSGLTVVQ